MIDFALLVSGCLLFASAATGVIILLSGLFDWLNAWWHGSPAEIPPGPGPGAAPPAVERPPFSVSEMHVNLSLNSERLAAGLARAREQVDEFVEAANAKLQSVNVKAFDTGDTLTQLLKLYREVGAIDREVTLSPAGCDDYETKPAVYPKEDRPAWVALAPRVLRWVLRRGPVTAWELSQHFKGLRKKGDAEAVLAYLAVRGCGEWRSRRPGPKGGRYTSEFVAFPKRKRAA
jgi:hypothetical protein